MKLATVDMDNEITAGLLFLARLLSHSADKHSINCVNHESLWAAVSAVPMSGVT